MKRDIHTEITAKFVAMIENAEASGDLWNLPWRRQGGSFRRPTNHTTGRGYRGVNVPMLWGAAQEGGFEASSWATFKQWQSIGAQVRKGEKGSQIVFFRKIEVEDQRAESGKREIPMLRISYVFNAEQVDGVELEQLEDLQDETQALDAADMFIANTGADITHGGGRAYYRPSTDEIYLPERKRFIGDQVQATEGYYSTALHELTHWTGHATRLNRLSHGNGFGSADYAKEELIAELGAAFLCADLGVTNAPRDDHAHYLASWLSALKNDSRLIFQAASAADKACDFMKDLQEKEAFGIAA